MIRLMSTPVKNRHDDIMIMTKAIILREQLATQLGVEASSINYHKMIHILSNMYNKTNCQLPVESGEDDKIPKCK